MFCNSSHEYVDWRPPGMRNEESLYAFYCVSPNVLKSEQLKHLHFKNQIWGSKVPRTSFTSSRFHCGLSDVIIPHCAVYRWILFLWKKVLLVCVCLHLYGLWWHHFRMTAGGYVVEHSHTFDDRLGALRVPISRYFYVCCSDRTCHDFICEHQRNFNCSRQHSDTTQTWYFSNSLSNVTETWRLFEQFKGERQ
jgi:hypothetical protein